MSVSTSQPFPQALQNVSPFSPHREAIRLFQSRCWQKTPGTLKEQSEETLTTGGQVLGNTTRNGAVLLSQQESSYQNLKRRECSVYRGLLAVIKPWWRKSANLWWPSKKETGIEIPDSLSFSLTSSDTLPMAAARSQSSRKSFNLVHKGQLFWHTAGWRRVKRELER